jgi:hypothetical protein
MPKRGRRQAPKFGQETVKRRRLQTGGGANFPIFHGQRFQYGGQMQRGRGLGGMFRGLLRTVAPHLKRGLAHVGKRAVAAGLNAVNDMVENKTSMREAFKKQAKNELLALNPINMLKARNKGVSSRRKRRVKRPPGLS